VAFKLASWLFSREQSSAPYSTVLRLGDHIQMEASALSSSKINKNVVATTTNIQKTTGTFQPCVESRKYYATHTQEHLSFGVTEKVVIMVVQQWRLAFFLNNSD
jgi:hypothetical protein